MVIRSWLTGGGLGLALLLLLLLLVLLLLLLLLFEFDMASERVIKVAVHTNNHFAVKF